LRDLGDDRVAFLAPAVRLRDGRQRQHGRKTELSHGVTSVGIAIAISISRRAADYCNRENEAIAERI
jgi:hypothetical protein